MTGRYGTPRFVVATTQDLDARARAEIVRVCVAAHDEPDFENLFTYINPSIPSGGRHFMAFDGEELAAHAVVTPRWLRYGDMRLTTAYVDAVATLPTYEGQGYGTAVMRMLAQNVEEYEICCLETERPPFYERLGWELWRGPLGGLRGDEVSPTPEQQGIMILRTPRTPPLDLGAELLIEADGRIW